MIKGMLIFSVMLSGYTLGFLLTIFIKYSNKKIAYKNHLKTKKKNQSKQKRIDESEPVKTNSKEILEKKLNKNGPSLLEFNCAADGIDSADYIRKIRTREDSAYNILRTKKKSKPK